MFEYQLNSLGSIQPCCHHGAGRYSNTQAIAIQNQVRTHSWVERVHIQVKCLAQGQSATPRQPKPQPDTSRSKVAGYSHRITTHCMYMEYIVRYRDLEGGHCQGTCRPQWFFTSHSNSVRRNCHIRGLASREKYTACNVEGRETSLHKPLPQRASNPGPVA